MPAYVSNWQRGCTGEQHPTPLKHFVVLESCKVKRKFVESCPSYQLFLALHPSDIHDISKSQSISRISMKSYRHILCPRDMSKARQSNRSCCSMFRLTARLAMSVALAANQNTSDKKLRDAFQRKDDLTMTRAGKSHWNLKRHIPDWVYIQYNIRIYIYITYVLTGRCRNRWWDLICYGHWHAGESRHLVYTKNTSIIHSKNHPAHSPAKKHTMV